LSTAAAMRLSGEWHDSEEQRHHGHQGDCLFHWLHDVFSFFN
jgi:hypothetical protein